MVFTASQIEEIVSDLSQTKLTHTLGQIEQLERFHEFKTQNKLFYEMILSPEGLNKSIFKEMMKMKRRLESGEDQYSVDVKFGQYMADKYIEPVTKDFNFIKK
jgi:hypothetical protein